MLQKRGGGDDLLVDRNRIQGEDYSMRLPEPEEGEPSGANPGI
jgi:hypothetical protein